MRDMIHGLIIGFAASSMIVNLATLFLNMKLYTECLKAEDQRKRREIER